jgi:hypothetical protein
MNDAQVRSALKRKVISRYLRDREAVVVEELGLRHGAARVDIALVNGRIHGFEVKSDEDTLRRLPRQMKIYNSVFERVTLIVGRRHLAGAAAMVPRWWGIKCARKRQCGDIVFSTIQTESDNPSPDILGMAKLLWRGEALELLDELNSSRGFRSKPRAVIYDRLCQVVGLSVLRDRIRRQFRTRKGWRSDAL